ncbi:MAG: hypothetical protein HW420_1404 [Candidatus Nitrosotenuis sp.]|nr:hypothetical protein [Candidatus Nitrosotenuis sp.]
MPNVEIIANPTGPQLQAPADAPIIEPIKLPPIFFGLFCRVLILYTFIGITRPDRQDIARIRINPTILSYGIENTKNGVKNTYSESEDNDMTSPANITAANDTYE